MRPACLAISMALLTTSLATGQSQRVALTGQLVDVVTRAPIPGGVVELAKAKRRILTDSLGHFAFPAVAPGMHELTATALGYREVVSSAPTGGPVLLLLTPEPVPMAAITALAHAKNDSRVRGATLKVFGRAELLAAGDIPIAQFVRWKTSIQTRMCQTHEVFNTSLGGAFPSEMLPAEWHGAECIYGSRDRSTGNPSMMAVHVMVDGEPVRLSDELWAHQTWDLGRVEVLHQYSGISYPFNRPFVFIRLYSPRYLAQTAAKASHLCEHVTSGDKTREPLLAALCEP